jgi:hypothetical protein
MRFSLYRCDNEWVLLDRREMCSYHGETRISAILLWAFRWL